VTATDPALAILFHVEVDGVDIGSWTECSGLSAEFDLFEWNEGGNNEFVHRLPGRIKYSNVTLVRAIDHQSVNLAAWFSGLQRSVSRKTASISAFDGNHDAIATWNLVGVWPVKYTGPTLSSDGSGVAKETLELAHNGFDRGA
jgi:phage tail-like protein